jgi:hypothetical protein
LIDIDDLNINNPQARIFIKPFINIDDKNDIIYHPEDSIYGTAPESFKNFIDKIFKKFSPKSGAYSLTPGLYNDDDDGEGEDGERIIDFDELERDKRQKEIGKKIVKNIPLSKDELNLDSLMLFDKNITSLPDGLNIKYLLSLSNNPNLKYLPNDIKIGGNLWLGDTGIEDLPKNLRVQAIDLSNTPLAKKYKNDKELIRKAYPNLGSIFI